MDDHRPEPPHARERTPRSRVRFGLLRAAVWLWLWSSPLGAQGVTTTAIRGTVEAVDGTDVDGTSVEVRHEATGFVVRTEVRYGRFLVQGLEVGGPYTVGLRRLGFAMQEHEGIHLTLGELLDLHFTLEPGPIDLDPLLVEAGRQPRATGPRGIATTIADPLLHRLPTLNRNLYDFVVLAPQVSTRIGFAPGGMSGGGVGFRFNSFLVDGAPVRSVGGNQPPEFAGARSLPFDAVSEYQVLVAPFDVRYGDFAGALVNAVTRSGTNDFRGSGFASGRSDALARSRGFAGDEPYERRHYGLSLGGPIRRDRAHFFVASEAQRLTWPAPGPYLGQPAGLAPTVPVTEGDLARLDGILSGHGLGAGSGGPVENRNPDRNVFARIDVGFPEQGSRAVLTWSDARSRLRNFARPPAGSFPLSTQAATQEVGAQAASLRLHTVLGPAGGRHNELLVSYRSAEGRAFTDLQQPIVRVGVPGTTGGTVTVVAGPPRQAHGRRAGFRSSRVSDNLSLPVGTSHVITLGLDVERFQSHQVGLLNAYGTWTFSSLDSLAAGQAHSYEVSRDFGSAGVPMSGWHTAVYAGDRWRAWDGVDVTAGVRAEVVAVDGRAPYNPLVDSLFGRRTDQMPRRRVAFSPRVGVAWDVAGTGRHRLTGGVGLFAGRPPLAWVHGALQGYGAGTGILSCGPRPQDLGPAPPFEPDHRATPAACADGAGQTPPGEVALLDRDLRIAQSLRGALAYQHRLPLDLLGSVEVLAARMVSDFVFVNLNLREPRGTDPHGRVMYGTIGPEGVARPGFVDDSFQSVTELKNTSTNRSIQVSSRVERRFSDGFAAAAYYTYSRVRDAQTPLRVYPVEGVVNWSSRAVSGRHDDLRPGVSLNDVPHRVVLAGTVRAPWRRWITEVSFLYVGESGSPFTYVAYGQGNRGDLNADGSNLNDPVYVPRNALDAEEILFSGQADEPGADNSPAALAERELRRRTAFEGFISRTPCLRRQRGAILERNSCREPWSNTTVATVRQSIPVYGHTLEAQIDIFNVLNLLHRDWGHRRAAVPQLLEHVAQTPEPIGESRPVFRFHEAEARWHRLRTESSFQLQLALRYRF